MAFHLVRLFFFHFAQRERWAAAIFLREAADIGLRTLGMRDPLDFRSSPPRLPRPANSRIQPLHFSLHALSFLPQFPNYSRQVRHRSPSDRHCSSPSERLSVPIATYQRLISPILPGGNAMRLRRNEYCPIHKSVSCCGREQMPYARRLQPGIRRIEDPHHPRGYRELSESRCLC